MGKWRNEVLIEGEKSARLLARLEGLPGVNPNYDRYPVDVKLAEKNSFLKAVKRSIQFSELGLYNMFYKITKKGERQEKREQQ